MTLLVSAHGMRRLEFTEQALHRALSSVRRVEVIGTAASGNAAAVLASRLATVLASVRQGRVMHRTPDWSRYQTPEEESLPPFPPDIAPLLRKNGSAWIAAPSTDDSCFDVTIGASLARAATELGSFTIRRNALCLVVPTVRSQADRFVAAADYLNHIGYRMVIVFLASKSAGSTAQNSVSWARMVTSRLTAPTMVLRHNDLVFRNKTAHRGTAQRLMRLAGLLMSDGQEAEQ